MLCVYSKVTLFTGHAAGFRGKNAFPELPVKFLTRLCVYELFIDNNLTVTAYLTLVKH